MIPKDFDVILDNFKKKFGFKPTVNNCFEIIANNTQAMVETIYDVSFESEQQSKSNSRQSILNNYETQSEKGFIFERLFDIMIKFGFCNIFQTNLQIHPFHPN